MKNGKAYDPSNDKHLYDTGDDVADILTGECKNPTGKSYALNNFKMVSSTSEKEAIETAWNRI